MVTAGASRKAWEEQCLSHFVLVYWASLAQREGFSKLRPPQRQHRRRWCSLCCHGLATKPAFFSGSVTQSYSRTVCLHTGCGLAAAPCEEPKGRIKKPLNPAARLSSPGGMQLTISNALHISPLCCTTQAELILNSCCCQTVSQISINFFQSWYNLI